MDDDNFSEEIQLLDQIKCLNIPTFIARPFQNDFIPNDIISRKPLIPLCLLNKFSKNLINNDPFLIFNKYTMDFIKYMLFMYYTDLYDINITKFNDNVGIPSCPDNNMNILDDTINNNENSIQLSTDNVMVNTTEYVSNIHNNEKAQQQQNTATTSNMNATLNESTISKTLNDNTINKTITENTVNSNINQNITNQTNDIHTNKNVYPKNQVISEKEFKQMTTYKAISDVKAQHEIYEMKVLHPMYTTNKIYNLAQISLTVSMIDNVELLGGPTWDIMSKLIERYYNCAFFIYNAVNNSSKLYNAEFLDKRMITLKYYNGIFLLYGIRQNNNTI